jgi:F0F1-type ATP synthase assembly protein I
MDDKDSKTVGTYFGLALMVVLSTFLGYAVGYGLDKLFGTHFFNIIFLAVCTAAAIFELIRRLS